MSLLLRGENYRSLLQNTVSFIGLFCKTDMYSIHASSPQRRSDMNAVHVCFEKEPYKRDCILQKRPVILKSLQVVAFMPPLLLRGEVS